MDATQLYTAGNLKEAVEAAVADVKRLPTDLGKRMFLCELLCFAGHFDRADRQLETIEQQDPKLAVEVATFRQLLRADAARQQFYEEGRVPEFLEAPLPRLKYHLEASIHAREGQSQEAARLLAEADRLRPAAAGTSCGKPFEDFRDIDDLTSSFFEVLTTTGKYYWIPIEQVELLECHKPRRPRDLLWRPAHMIVRGGPDGEVFLPVLYAGSRAEPDDRLRLGRMTDWRGGDGSPVRGIGQRMYLVGEEAQGILELGDITFTPVESGASHATHSI